VEDQDRPARREHYAREGSARTDGVEGREGDDNAYHSSRNRRAVREEGGKEQSLRPHYSGHDAAEGMGRR